MFLIFAKFRQYNGDCDMLMSWTQALNDDINFGSLRYILICIFFLFFGNGPSVSYVESAVKKIEFGHNIVHKKRLKIKRD